jgi:hypothetical protein
MQPRVPGLATRIGVVLLIGVLAWFWPGLWPRTWAVAVSVVLALVLILKRPESRDWLFPNALLVWLFLVGGGFGSPIPVLLCGYFLGRWGLIEKLDEPAMPDLLAQMDEEERAADE